MSLAVLLPVYRNQLGLEQSLKSLESANGAFDVVVVDDGSPQQIYVPTEFLWGRKISLLRLSGNKGIAAALNHGLRYILERPYSYVGRLDAGDLVATERFTQQVRFLDSHPDCAVVSSFVEFIDAAQQSVFRHRAPCEDPRIRRALRLNNCILHPGTTIRARAFRECGLYREDVLGAEDYELFLRIARSHTLAVLPEVLTHSVYMSSGLSVSGRRQQQWTRLKLQLNYFDPASPYSFLGVARTFLAMMAPQAAVIRFKRAFMH
jgi:glycosyltransferase involved in cell wall biosynthesis